MCILICAVMVSVCLRHLVKSKTVTCRLTHQNQANISKYCYARLFIISATFVLQHIVKLARYVPVLYHTEGMAT